jgi:hypothetical protein
MVPSFKYKLKHFLKPVQATNNTVTNNRDNNENLFQLQITPPPTTRTVSNGQQRFTSNRLKQLT